MKIDLFLDLWKNQANFNKANLENACMLCSTAPTGAPLEDQVRFKITINLPDKYFIHQYDYEATVEEVKELSNDVMSGLKNEQ